MIELFGATKTYDLGSATVEALRGIDISFGRGEFITVMGPSGSGKSTLLHVLGMLDTLSTGRYELEGHDVTELPDRDVSRIRNRQFGFIFQSFNLFPEFNALENVIVPMAYAGIDRRDRSERAKQLLADMGLEHRNYHYPNMLSGGEQQRVAIARSLANDPNVILADEPTGNLPSDTGEEILAILDRLNRDGVTIVMVTHDERLGMRSSRLIRLRDGELESDTRSAA